MADQRAAGAGLPAGIGTVVAALSWPAMRDRGDGLLHIGERAIREAARVNGQGLNLPLAAARQAVTEAWVRTKRKADFRDAGNEAARAGYLAMSAGEFEGVNARQRWANWRTIPRGLDGACPARPQLALDLCCGTGDSTAVLAWHLPEGSRIIGLEFQPEFVEQARTRSYAHAGGGAAEVSFRAQSVLERFRDADGGELAAGSIDLANSSGAVGCHFHADATAVLAAEIARVLRPGGLALIDAGEDGTPPAEVERIFAALGFALLRSSKSCRVDRYRQLCLRKSA
jgi:SAM-dependent methyltransferase